MYKLEHSQFPADMLAALLCHPLVYQRHLCHDVFDTL